jgi:3-hydroxyisobutyrate dehydrogenase-like beta-hydroxyacid dehydrogenase
VAFVGVGAIGLPMAVRIAGAGHSVIAFDVSRQRRELARAAGVEVADGMADLSGCDVAVFMVATGGQLEAALQGSGGALEQLAPGSLCIVMSTVGPEAVRKAARAVADRDVGLVDAPVTGGVAGASAGSLTIFASGDPSLLDAAEPVLAPMGGVRPCGPEVGQGQFMKVINQLLASVHLVAAAEALAFARRVGLDPRRVLESIKDGAAGSWMLNDRGPRMLEGTDVEVTSAVDIFVKDSDLVAAAAADAGFDAPLLRAANAAFRAASDRGLGHRDDSRVIETYG